MTRKVTKNTRLKSAKWGFKPRYEHDCLGCKFVGHLANFDMYICGDHNIIARRSSEEGDYGSYDIRCMKPTYWVTHIAHSKVNTWNTFTLVVLRELHEAGVLNVSISFGGK